MKVWFFFTLNCSSEQMRTLCELTFSELVVGIRVSAFEGVGIFEPCPIE